MATTTTSNGATDLDTGLGALFGVLAAGAAGIALFADGLPRSFGFAGAVLFGALLIVSLHVYR